MSTPIRSATVLVVVLVILMIVSLAAYSFTLTMESEHLAIRNTGDRLIAQQAAYSGAEILTSLLELPRQDRLAAKARLRDGIELWPSIDDPTIDFQTFVDFGLNGTTNAGLPLDSEKSNPRSNNRRAAKPMTPGSNAMWVAPTPMIDESSKLNLHSLLDWDLVYPGQARKALLQLNDMDESTADQILDWIDTDSLERGRGYEVNARNSIPLYVEELPRGTSSPDESLLNTRPAWLDSLTVSSAERNEAFDGQPRIDVNQASLLILHQQLLKVVPLPLANYIIALRQYGQSQTSGKKQEAAALTLDFNVPATTRITSLIDLLNSQVAIPSERGRETVPSPIDPNVGLAGMAVGQILDHLTLTSSRRLIGRINLMEASPEVIAGVPGLDNTLALQIVTGRAVNQETTYHAYQILFNAGIPQSSIERALPYLTVGGDVLRAPLVGYSNQGDIQYRYQVLIDASSNPSRWSAMVEDRFNHHYPFQTQ